MIFNYKISLEQQQQQQQQDIFSTNETLTKKSHCPFLKVSVNERM